MKEIWVIISKSGIVRTRYGFFETEQECQGKCEELVRLRACPENYYRARSLTKYDGLGKN